MSSTTEKKEPRRVALVRMSTKASILDSTDLTDMLKRARIDAFANIAISRQKPTDKKHQNISSDAERPSGTSIVSVANTHIEEEEEDDEDQKRKCRPHKFRVRVRSTWLDLDDHFTERFKEGPFEFAQLDVDALRTPRDFVVLREGLLQRLNTSDSSLPPLPPWVTTALRMKQRASTAATAAGVTAASLAAAVAVVTGTAPILAIGAGVLLVATVATTTRGATIARAEHDINPDCTWLIDVKRALSGNSTAPHRNLRAAIFYLKLFLCHKATVAIYQRPRGTIALNNTLNLPQSYSDDKEKKRPSQQYMANLWNNICEEDDETKDSREHSAKASLFRELLQDDD